MCGIVGVYDFADRGEAIEPCRFDRMVDRLAHRGPDGRGVWLEPGIAIGHRRLAILDPSPAGAQPMSDAAKRCVISHNGEIYNFRELRKELRDKGYIFRSETDTEVLLAGYLAWGEELPPRLNGIFAFALWDSRTRMLFLVRDRIGVKPLFYSIQGGVLRFASEIKALLEDPAVPRKPDRAGIQNLLTLGYVSAPETGFEGIRQLPPAHQARVTVKGIELRRYWLLSMAERPISPAQAQEDFAARLHRAVQRQLISDVPLGAFLSGGLDSAAIVAEMGTQKNSPIRTFTASFPDPSFDEGVAAQRSAQLLATLHTQVNVVSNLQRSLDRMVEHCEDPLADSSWLAVDRVAEAAAGGVKVVLSGDGADELLAGYVTHRASELARWYRVLPGWCRASARHIVARWPASNARYGRQQFASRFVLGAEAPEGRDFASWRIHFRQEERELLCRPGFFEGLPDPVHAYARCYWEAPGAHTRLKRRLHADLTYYLPGDMLPKVDRSSMAHGLEVRVPFLDHELVEFCAGLPDRCLQPSALRGRTKPLLRRHLSARVSREIARRPKRGFNVPIESAMRTTFRTRFRDVVTSQAFRTDGPFDVDCLLAWADRHDRCEIDAGHALFSAMFLAEWWRRWLGGH